MALPQVTLFNSSLRIGPPSDVTLTTTYLDLRLRLGRGGYGSIFVFVRGGDADKDAWSEIGKVSDLAGSCHILSPGCLGLRGAAP